MRKSKKGAALIYTLIIILFLSALALSLLMVATGSRIATARYNNLNKARLVSESGVEKAIAKLKEKIALNPDSILNISSSDNFQFTEDNVNCTVSYSYPNGDINKILIKVNSSVGNTNKEISVTLNKITSFINNNYVNNLMGNAVTVLDDVNSETNSFITSSLSSMDIYGPMYLQGSKVNIVPKNLYIDGDLNVKAVSFIQGESNLVSSILTNLIKGKIRVDAQDINLGLSSLGSLSYFLPTQSPTAIKTKLETINMLDINPNKVNNAVSKGNSLAVLVTNNNKFRTINNIFTSSGVSQSTYKIVMVHGNLTIDSSADYSNYIIYCDGKVTVSLPDTVRTVSMFGGLLHYTTTRGGVVTFVNSSITSKQMEITGRSYLVLKKMKDSDIASILTNINNKIINNLDDYYDSLNVEIIDWKE